MPAPSEMEERVAKSILGLDGCSEGFKLKSARAAIAAMREPIMRALADAPYNSMESAVADLFDAALKGDLNDART